MYIRLPANNVTGSGQPSEPSEKRPRANPPRNELLGLARTRRISIMEEFSTFGEPDAAVLFANPAFYKKLLFPFVGSVLPQRFNLDNEERWSYMGRERFKDLLSELNGKWSQRSALWLYGTKGYGKSHLLAALAYYLATTKARIIYIPNCRELIRDPISYLQASMMFAFAEDDERLKEISSLDTFKKMNR
jgi:hypothetical protein